MRWTAAAMLLLAATLTGCGGDGVDAPTDTLTPSASTAAPASPTPATTPPSSPSPTALLIPGAIELTRGTDAPFPDDMAFIIETGCWGCDGGPGSLVRLYRDPSGAIRSETILDPNSLGYPPQHSTSPDGTVYEYGPQINGVAMNPDGSTIAVSLCIHSGCDAGGIGTWQADSVSAILLSTNGGITWKEVGQGGPALSVIGLLDDRDILTMNYLEPLGSVEFRTYPGNRLLTPPAGASDYPPLVTVAGQPLWRTGGGGLLLGDGTVLISDRGDIRVGWRIIGDLSPDKGSFLLSVDLAGPAPYYVGLEVYDMTGNTPTLRQLYTGVQFVIPGWWSPKDDRAVITVDVPPPPEYLGVPVPALLDLSSGEYRPITDPFVPDERPYQPYGRSRVDAVQIGPFARIVTPGSCLNIRLSPSLTSEVGDCAADGVLLTDAGETRDTDGVSWVRVRTPAGLDGWASANYLERRVQT